MVDDENVVEMRRRKRGRACRHNNQIKVGSGGDRSSSVSQRHGMAGVDGERPIDTTINKKRLKNGNGWRRGEEGSEGEGKSGATTDIILLYKNSCALAALICMPPIVSN